MDGTSGFRTGRHVVYKLHVHLVFVTKYRRGVISDRVRADLETSMRKVCRDFESELIEIDGEDDHIHLLIAYPPKHSISKLVNGGSMTFDVTQVPSGLLVAQSVRAEDAVTAANLDPTLEYVFFYANGRYANEAAVRARCPHAELFGITVIPGEPGWMIDCEAEDFDLTQAETMLADELAAGQYRPCVYASLSTWLADGLLYALERYGDQIRRAVAWYQDPISYAIPEWADACQNSTNGVDTWVCLPNFFDAARPPAGPHGIASVRYDFDLAHGLWIKTELPGKAIHWGTEDKRAAVELELTTGGPHAGEWRDRPLPFNSPPLGGPGLTGGVQR